MPRPPGIGHSKADSIPRSQKGTRSPSQLSGGKNRSRRSRAERLRPCGTTGEMCPTVPFLPSPSSLVGAAQSECPPEYRGPLRPDAVPASWERTKMGKDGESEGRLARRLPRKRPQKSLSSCVPHGCLATPEGPDLPLPHTMLTFGGMEPSVQEWEPQEKGSSRGERCEGG